MKKALISVAFSSMALWAVDANTMRVYSASGSPVDTKLTDVDSIQFTTPDSLQLFKANVKVTTLPLLGVDSIGFVYVGSSGSGTSSNCVNGRFTDARDGQTYKCVTIGTQTWMAQNLNYIPSGGNSWCYGDDTTNCKTDGRLYDWATTMALPNTCNSTDCASQVQPKRQGICHTGWHVPTDEEWKTLEMYAGMTQTEADGTGWRGSIGTKLKSKTNWNGTDDFGFSALPAGFRFSSGFKYWDSSAYFWSASQSGAFNAWGRSMDGSVSRDDFDGKETGFSLRCLQD